MMAICMDKFQSYLTVLLLVIMSTCLGLSATAAGKKASVVAAKTQVTWYGHAAFKIVTPNQKVIWIDPWILNPSNPQGKEDMAKFDRADLILVTHGHFDHVGQAAEIAKKTSARLVATFDLAGALAQHGGFPADHFGYDSAGNFGGVLSFFDGEVNIALVPAVHSSAINPKGMGVSQEDTNYDAGNPAGFVVMVKNGPNIYHTGDTDLFSDMALIKKYGKIDLMLTCIGGHFSMGPERAADAVKLVDARHVVAMHFGTFPTVLTGTPEEFKTALKKLGLEKRLMPMNVHQTLEF
jgi:L-ascorbate metabolism protein UlaG (beta-lactamase superfamily)